MHCSPTRAVLEAAPEQNAHPLRPSLKQLAERYLTKRWSQLVPSAVLRDVFLADPSFSGGGQHDAAELLQTVFAACPSLRTAADSHATSSAHGVIAAHVPEQVIDVPRVSLPSLIELSLQGDSQPRTLPDCLWICFPQIYQMADKSWYFDAQVTGAGSAFRLHVAGHAGGEDGDDVAYAGPASLEYVVRAIIRHEHGGEASLTCSSGHYVAYLHQKQKWYCDQMQPH